MKAKCIDNFVAEQCDDNGFSIENSDVIIKKGSIWEIEEDAFRVAGGEIRLIKITDMDSLEWLEIPKGWFEKNFELM